jgi:hypothetical protein
MDCALAEYGSMVMWLYIDGYHTHATTYYIMVFVQLAMDEYGIMAEHGFPGRTRGCVVWLQ